MRPVGCIHNPWWQTHHPHLGELLNLLKAEGVSARLVGGAVRDTLLYGSDIDYKSDIDLAIDVTPDTLIALCLKLGVQVIPTGVTFGTVTCLLNQTPYEFTSLRKDVSTDGRKAIVAFTKNWVEDAYRRDFTINALYADWDGAYYDPTEQGVEDLRAEYIRFIGDPAARIKEDYLRIIRFFRFQGLFEYPKYCESSYAACVDNANDLRQISKERKWNELQRIFKTKYPIGVFEALIASRVILNFCRLNWSLNKLANTITWRDTVFSDIFYLMLGSINSFKINTDFCIPMSLQKRLYQVITVLLDAEINWKTVYWVGKDVYKDALIRKSISTKKFKGDALEHLNAQQQIVETWLMPKFPINGNDLQEMGFPEGPLIGALLKDAEKWWVEQEFTPDYEASLDYIRKLHVRKLKETI